MKRRLRSLAAPAAALLAVIAAACDGGGGTASSPAATKVSAPGGPLGSLLAASEQAPWTTRYAGERRVELHELVDGAWVDLAYRERVVADGEGRFAIEPLEALTWVHPSESVFLLLQDLREGYFYRYRGFAVRDLGLLLASHQVVDLGVVEDVAGRPAAKLLVTALAPGGTTTTAWLDQETGLVLRYEERDAAGVLREAMAFETFDPAPELDGVAWSEPVAVETPLDVAADLDEAAGFDVLEPRDLPAGYALWKAATLDDGLGRTWAKLVYTDGDDALFLFHTAGVTKEERHAFAAAIPTSKPGGVLADEVIVYEIGSATAVLGALRGRGVMALGEVSADELVDALESSIP